MGKILSQFNNMKDYNLQNIYLCGLVQRQPVKMRGNNGCDGKAQDGKGNVKKCTYQYFVQTPTYIVSGYGSLLKVLLFSLDFASTLLRTLEMLCTV